MRSKIEPTRSGSASNSRLTSSTVSFVGLLTPVSATTSVNGAPIAGTGGVLRLKMNRALVDDHGVVDPARVAVMPFLDLVDRNR